MRIVTLSDYVIIDVTASSRRSLGPLWGTQALSCCCLSLEKAASPAWVTSRTVTPHRSNTDNPHAILVTLSPKGQRPGHGHNWLGCGLALSSGSFVNPTKPKRLRVAEKVFPVGCVRNQRSKWTDLLLMSVLRGIEEDIPGRHRPFVFIGTRKTAG